MKGLFFTAAALLAGATLSAQESSYGFRDEQNLRRNYGQYQQNDQQQNRSYQSRSSMQGSQSQVRRMNRASNLIGADVRLRDGQKAGEVKDVVIDFNSGRVAYIVVDANDVLEGDRTHIAVPARAFRLSGDQRQVTLDADRSKLRQVRAFAANSLPPIRSRSEQMTRWQGDSRSTYSQQDPWNQDQSRDYSAENRSSSAAPQDDVDWYLYEWHIIEPAQEYSSNPYWRQPSPDSNTGSSRQNQGAYENYNRTENSFSSRNRYSQDQNRYGQTGNQRYWRDQNRRQQGEYDQQRYTQNSRDQQRQSQNRSWQRQNQQNRYGLRQNDQGSAYSEYNSQREQDSDQDRQNTAHYEDSGVSATAESGRSGTASDQSSGSTQRFSGWVRDVDEQRDTIMIEGEDRTLTFKHGQNATVAMNNGENGSVDELEEGERVEVTYRFQNGSNQILTIRKSDSQ